MERVGVWRSKRAERERGKERGGEKEKEEMKLADVSSTSE